MTFWNTFAAELRKVVTLPASWVAVAVTLFGSAGITVLNAVAARTASGSGAQGSRDLASAFETAYAAAPLGTVGAVVLGVVVMSSEYAANSTDAGSGRQITATLAASPRRTGLLLAKALTVVLLVALTAAATIPACVGVARLLIGAGPPETVRLDDALLRSLGAALYWTLTGLIALAITTLARSGIIPLVVLIANSSVVSFSLLLTNVTPLAHWLPDLAGRRLFVGMPTVDGGLATGPGAIVMGSWTLALLAVAGLVFSRRDA